MSDTVEHIRAQMREALATIEGVRRTQEAALRTAEHAAAWAAYAIAVLDAEAAWLRRALDEAAVDTTLAALSPPARGPIPAAAVAHEPASEAPPPPPAPRGASVHKDVERAVRATFVAGSELARSILADEVVLLAPHLTTAQVEREFSALVKRGVLQQHGARGALSYTLGGTPAEAVNDPEP